MKLLNDQRGVVIAYLTVFFCVIAVAIIWLIFNEIILSVGSWSTAYATESMGSTYSILIMLWRCTPIVMLLGAIMWAIIQAHKHSVMGG